MPLSPPHRESTPQNEFRGWVALDCPRCRKVRAFQVHDQEVERTVFRVIPLFFRRTRRLATCNFCGERREITGRAELQVSLQWVRADSLPRLAARTNPALGPVPEETGEPTDAELRVFLEGLRRWSRPSWEEILWPLHMFGGHALLGSLVLCTVLLLAGASPLVLPGRIGWAVCPFGLLCGLVFAVMSYVRDRAEKQRALPGELRRRLVFNHLDLRRLYTISQSLDARLADVIAKECRRREERERRRAAHPALADLAAAEIPEVPETDEIPETDEGLGAADGSGLADAPAPEATGPGAGATPLDQE